MKTSEQKREMNKKRREYRKTHPNGRVAGRLDENDRSVIKDYCKSFTPSLKALVDLEKNSCLIYASTVFIGEISKIIYKDVFVLQNSFSLYPNRNPLPGERCRKILLPAGTELIVCEDNKNQFFVFVDDDYIRVDRWIFAKSANIKQLYSLFILNAENGIGVEDNQYKIDLIQLIKCNYTYSNPLHHVLAQ